MNTLYLRMLVKTVVQIVYASLLLSSAQVQAQNIVGLWHDRQNSSVVWQFDGSGRWSWTTTGACPGEHGRSGSYTAADGKISITGDAATSCFSPGAYFYGSGSYVISGATLDIHLTGGAGGPVTILLAEVIDLSMLMDGEIYAGSRIAVREPR